MYYFGYGSNMASRVMKVVCPEHELIGKAKLSDYRLAFTRESPRWGHGVADIVPAQGQHVWGVLYRIDDVCLHNLNIKEGIGVAYQQIEVNVLTDTGYSYQAISYEVIHKLVDEILPSRAYAETFIEGASEHDLPSEYIAFLKAIKIAE